MSIEKRPDKSPSRRDEHHGDEHEFWTDIGVDVDDMSPRAQAVTGVVVGGIVLSAAAFLILFTSLWWLIFVFGWAVFPAFGLMVRGIAGLSEGSGPRSLPWNKKERELFDALRKLEELTPAQAAMETSLTVAEADDMLKELAKGGHLDVRVRGGGLFYALWEHEREEPRELRGRG